MRPAVSQVNGVGSASLAVQRRHPCSTVLPVHKPVRRCCRAATTSSSGGFREDELEVSVFRFTLGIPGFDDAQVPRIVGATGAFLLAANHVFSEEIASSAQIRAEVLGIVLASLCFATPYLEAQLKALLPGRGRQAVSGGVEGGVNIFALADGLSDEAQQELAWASFTLLRNTNVCGVMLVQHGSVVMARGTVGPAAALPDGSKADLETLSKAVSLELCGTKDFQAVANGHEAAVYLPDAAALASTGATSWSCVPRGVKSMLLQSIGNAEDARSDRGGGRGKGQGDTSVLLLMSERPRSLSQKERRWVAALADKLDQVAVLSHA